MKARRRTPFQMFARLAAILLFGLCCLSTQTTEGAVPAVKMKVAEYSNELIFTCTTGAAWKLGDKRGTLRKSDRCQLKGKLSRSAQKRFHVMVESVPFRKPDLMKNSLAKWRASGRKIHTLEFGAKKYGPDGKTIRYDGRILLIGAGKFDDQKRAQTLVDELASEGSSAWVLEEVIKPATGELCLLVNRKKVAESSSPFVLTPKTTVQLQKVEFARGYSWHGFRNRTFRGSLRVQWGAQDAIDCVLDTDLETVLSGVVPSEISSKAAPGALQAQAVAARGEILSKIGLRHIGEGFNFCSEQHCQVFAGETPESISVGRAVACTQGILLAAPDGSFVDAVYAANCGGHGDSNHLVWTSAPDPQLVGVWDTRSSVNLDLTNESDLRKYILNPPPCNCDDPTLEGGNKFRWTKNISSAEWKEVEDRGGVGKIREFKDFARGPSGRLYKITFVGEKGPRTIMKELNIRKFFGGLRSACFIVKWETDSKGFINGASFNGAGWGHGVGMCQTGAQGLARAGANYEKILLHYFPGSKFLKVY